jgi:CrcB protein
MAMIGSMYNPSVRINPVAGSALEALLVGIGAIPGAWLRLKAVNHFEPMVPKKHWGTFAVNVIACFGLGVVLALVQSCSAKTGLALLIGVGFFGSLSTFSTFAVELLNELRAGRPFVSLVLALASIAAGLCAAGAGYGLGAYG